MVLNGQEAFTIHTVNDKRPKDCIQKSDPNWEIDAGIEIAKITSAF